MTPSPPSSTRVPSSPSVLRKGDGGLAAPRGHMRILVVDDDAVFRQELGDLLEADGHEVAIAPSVPKALEELEARDVDVVFTDLKMPRHSGLELLKEVRRRWPQTLVVMVTGFATVETAVEALKAGAFDYIRKPFQIEQVQKVLEVARGVLEFRRPSGRRGDLDHLLREWGARPELSVLVLSPHAPAARPRLTHVVPDYENPSEIVRTIREFAQAHPVAAVLLEEVDRCFTHHRRADILPLVGAMTEAMDGHGPFVISYDPSRLGAADVRALTATVTSSETRETLEAIANPLRRAILQRALQGPISFSEAMHAAGLDDSPKLAFHLRRLVDGGLLTHEDEEYRITARGREVVRAIFEMDASLPTRSDANAVLPLAGSG